MQVFSVVKGKMHSAEIPDGYICCGLMAPCRAAGCTGRIQAINFGNWTEVCSDKHSLPLPDKAAYTVDDGRVWTLTRDGEHNAYPLTEVTH